LRKYVLDIIDDIVSYSSNDEHKQWNVLFKLTEHEREQMDFSKGTFWAMRKTTVGRLGNPTDIFVVVSVVERERDRGREREREVMFECVKEREHQPRKCFES